MGKVAVSLPFPAVSRRKVLIFTSYCSLLSHFGIGFSTADCGGRGGQEKREAAADVKEGVASIAILPCGSISGHFIRLPHSVCYGLHGTVLACERECSRGEDYRLIKLSILDFQSAKATMLLAFKLWIMLTVNIGPMRIEHLDFDWEDDHH